MRFLLVIIAALLTVGCVSQEGVALSRSEWGVEQILEQRELRNEPKVPVDLIMIGTVSAFRALTNENFEDIYSEYSEFAMRLNPDNPIELSAEDFKSGIAGWTRVKIFTIPLVIGNYDYALVPIGIHADIRFPSSTGTFLVQETGDLLAARTNRDGYFLIKRVLCKDGKGYFECSKNYRKGLFDGSTGEELILETLMPKKYGKPIDPVSYQALDVQP